MRLLRHFIPRNDRLLFQLTVIASEAKQPHNPVTVSPNGASEAKQPHHPIIVSINGHSQARRRSVQS